MAGCEMQNAKWIAIAAMAENRVIGCQGKIPWHIKEELQFFKKTTLGHVLVMGRKTFESIGRALPGRTTWVLTRSTWTHPEIQVCRSLDEVTAEPGQTIFVAGGGEVYAQALARCDELILTVVRGKPDGEVYFPAFEDGFIRSEKLVEHLEFETWRWLQATRVASSLSDLGLKLA
jgi:dihydrofolate reductase